jgi:hypothetical protein
MGHNLINLALAQQQVSETEVCLLALKLHCKSPDLVVSRDNSAIASGSRAGSVAHTQNTGDSMKTLRSFSSVVLLAVSVSSLLSGSSAAQTFAHGTFTLAHEVHWQNALVPAGDYEFFVDRSGGSQFLMLKRAGAGSTGFFLMIPSSEPSESAGIDKLLIVVHGDERFVSSLDLPQYGVNLDFAVPVRAANSVKPLTQAAAMTSARSE